METETYPRTIGNHGDYVDLIGGLIVILLKLFFCILKNKCQISQNGVKSCFMHEVQTLLNTFEIFCRNKDKRKSFGEKIVRGPTIIFHQL
jgi:hypothetical protein